MDRSSWDPHVAAMLAYHRGDTSATIVVHDDYGNHDELPVKVFFRDPLSSSPFPLIERTALEQCRGRVLDVGAGAGIHSLILQQRDFPVCALEVHPDLCEILTERGVEDVREGDIRNLSDGSFDTVLMIMNGLGLAGTLGGLEQLLVHLKSLVLPGGQVLADSTDVRATFAGENGTTCRPDGRYVGEMDFQLEYDGHRAAPFAQLYVDPDTLVEYALRSGWSAEVMASGEGGAYLARLRHTS